MIDVMRCMGCNELMYTYMGFMCRRDRRVACINDRDVKVTWSTTCGEVRDGKRVGVSSGKGAEAVIR